MTWRLEVLVVDPARTGFRLDVTPLDSSARLLAPPAGTLRLDVGALDVDMLAPVAEPLAWVDLLPYATQVTARTSHRADSLVLAQEPGTLSAPLIDPPDLPILGVQRGTPLRLVKAGRVAWWGWVDTITTTWDADTGRTTALVAGYDVAGLWGSVTRYGARSAGPETLRDRLARLLVSSPVPALAPSWPTDDPVDLGAGGSLVIQGGALPPTAMETNLMAHVTMAAASCGLTVAARHPDTAAADYIATLSLIDPNAPAEPVLELVDHDAGPSYYTTAQFSAPTPVTVATVTTHLIGPTGDVDDVTATVTDPTGAALFGTVEGALDVTAEPELARALGERFLGLARLPTIGPTSVAIHGADDPGLACLDVVRVTRLGRTYTRRVAGVTHTITPTLGDDPDHLIAIDLTQ